MPVSRTAANRLAALLVGAALVAGAPGRAAEPQAASGTTASSEQLASIRSGAAAQLQRKHYAAAIASAQRYVRAGGAAADVRPLLVQAYLDSGDDVNAARELQFEVQAAERAGQAPGEDRLLLLQRCYARLNDANAVAWSLEKLVTWHPRREYWADLLDRTEKRPDFGAPLALDVNRLRLLTGTLGSPDHFLAMAVQAQQAGLPAEALRVVEQGFAKGLLGSGPDAASHRQLRRQLTEEAQAQRRLIGQREGEQAAQQATDGIELFRLGMAHASLGNFDKGLALMEQGLSKGGLENRPQHAKLRLGITLLAAGQRARAIDVFQSVGGRHGAADLGRIWAIYARNAK